MWRVRDANWRFLLHVLCRAKPREHWIRTGGSATNELSIPGDTNFIITCDRNTGVGTDSMFPGMSTRVRPEMSSRVGVTLRAE